MRLAKWDATFATISNIQLLFAFKTIDVFIVRKKLKFVYYSKTNKAEINGNKKIKCCLLQL